MHHAYLLVGEKDVAEKFVHSFWKKQGIDLKGSPDFFAWKEDLFGIEEARDLANKSAQKAFTQKKVFFLSPQRVSLEAQNALLKTFEDPHEDTHFFLTVRDENLILPTLRSRVEMLRLENEGGGVGEAKKFLSLSYAERLAFARKFADAEKNLSIFLDELLSFMRGKEESVKSIKEVYEARRYSDDRAVSTRLILEHLSLVL